MCRNSGIFRLGHLHGKDGLPVCHDIYGIFRRGHIPAVVAGHARTRLLKKTALLSRQKTSDCSRSGMCAIFTEDVLHLWQRPSRSSPGIGSVFGCLWKRAKSACFPPLHDITRQTKSRPDIYIRSASLFIPRLLCLHSVKIMQEFPEYLLFQ